MDFITKKQLFDFITSELAEQKVSQNRGSIRQDTHLGFNPVTQSLRVLGRKATGQYGVFRRDSGEVCIGTISFRFRDGQPASQARHYLQQLLPIIEKSNGI